MKLTIQSKIGLATSALTILLSLTLAFLVHYTSSVQAKKDAILLITKTLEHKSTEIERGLIVGDFDLNTNNNNVTLQTLVKNIKPYNQSKAFIISSKGNIIEHSNRSEIGQNLLSNWSEYDFKGNLSSILNNGKVNVLEGKADNGTKLVFFTIPITLNEQPTNYTLGLTVPLNEINSSDKISLIIILIILAIGIFIMPIFGWILGGLISNRLVKTNQAINILADGDITEASELKVIHNDEIGSINKAINILLNHLKNAAEFALQMGKGNLDADFELINEKDTLGIALLNMKQSLKQAHSDEIKRKEADKIQNWTTNGLAKFGETLRTNAQDIEKLSYEIVSSLINYLDINQGAMFVVDANDESDILLNLTAAVAYDRKKFMQKSISIKNGLVGRCAFEQKTIYMTEIPDDYIYITSGLGTANPSAILLVPLILNDEIYGVLELASFNKLEQYQIEFVEKLGESIASTIATVNINDKTSKLLEQSKTQSEDLASQEEEMRQNLEELQATQEEASRREFEMEGIIKALDNTAFTVEYDMDGNIISVNDKYAELLNTSADSLIGTNHAKGFNTSGDHKTDYEIFWRELKQGKTRQEQSKIMVNGNVFWLTETYTPIFEKNHDTPYKVLKIGFDISKQKERELLVKDQERRIKKEAMIIGEYRSKIKDLETEITKLQNQPREHIIIETNKVTEDAIENENQNRTEALEQINKPLVWNKQFEIGVPEMDEQHKQLIELAIILSDAYEAQKTKKELKENLRSLIDFSSYHFGNEESYFEQYNYEEKDTHTTEHANFIKKLSNYQKDYHANKIKDLEEVTHFISTWLTDHILSWDKKYTSIFK